MIKKPIRYILSGLFNTFVTYAVFVLLLQISESVLFSLSIAYVCGISISYLLGKSWVWNSYNKGSIYKLLMLQFISICINWLILHFVSLTNFPREIAQIFIFIIQALVFYFLNKNFVFKSNS
jgi:putative flippase GtrA